MKSFFSAVGTVLVFLILANSAYSGDRNLVNKSGTDITSIFISVPGSNSWNLISGSYLANGHSSVFSLNENLNNCSAVLKYIDVSGKEFITEEIDLCQQNDIVINAIHPESTPNIILKSKESK